jgi:GTP-binding protein
LFKKFKARGMLMLPIVAIIGRPNVGKSTLFNRIAQERISIVDNEKGVTRDRLYTRAEWLGQEFILIDTGGIEQDDVPFMDQIKLQAEIAMEEADIIVFVVSITAGITVDDEFIASLLYRVGQSKPVIVAVNYLDNDKLKDQLYEFYALGFDDVVGISAAHGIGVGDLLDNVLQVAPKLEDVAGPDTISFSIVGRPNVGKSSLVNALVGEERVIVSDVAGTTRDAIDTPFEHDGQKYLVIDTAGIRRKGKVQDKIEKYSILRALSAIDRSHIVLVVIDGAAGIQEQDKKIAGLAIEAGKGIIFVVNKWDIVTKDEKTMEKFKKKIAKEFKYADYAEIVFLSARTRERLQTLFPIIQNVHHNQNRRVGTSVLNEILQEAFILNPPPLRKDKRLKLYYASQVNTEPPTFVLFINQEQLAHFSYKRYLDNKIREAFAFEGTPIRLIFRPKGED